jgi:twitching motility protein PilT
VSRTISRVTSLSRSGDAVEIRERLGDALKGVVAQRLLPGAQEGRVLASEVLVVTGSAREAIRKPGAGPSLKDVMERGTHPYGMQTFEMHLRQLVSEGRVAVEVARSALG